MCIRLGCCEEFLEVLVTLLFLISSFSPLGDGLAMEDEDVEERVKEEDTVGLNRHAVKKHGLRWGIKGVGHEGRLDHDKGVVNIFFIEHMSRWGESV